MKIIKARNLGYCIGVRRAVNAAFACDPRKTCILGEIIHNPVVIEQLRARGVETIARPEDCKTPSVILRSHGVGDAVYTYFQEKGIVVKDCTCPFVMRTHGIIREYYKKGYMIVIAGLAGHDEVVALGGCCEDSALIVATKDEAKRVPPDRDVCVVAQTTFSLAAYAEIKEVIWKNACKTVEIFDTICYTTVNRQEEVGLLSAKCTKMLILGSQNSSNANQLYRIAKERCSASALIGTVKELDNIDFSDEDIVGITSGASTHDGLIQEVYQYMSDNNEVQTGKGAVEDFGEMLARHEIESVVPRLGSSLEVEVLSVGADGVTVSLGGKNDGFISKEGAVFEGEYNAADFAVGRRVGVTIIGTKNSETGLIPVSKKKFDAMQIGNQMVNTIRNGEEFSLTITEVVKNGLTGHLGNYRVFVPQSHIEERFIKNIANFKGKTLRLRAIEIDDVKFKIVASQKVILTEERVSKEKEFFDNIEPELVVIGKVMRITKFGAFVDVGGFDCLAHIVDLSWTKINSVEEVLKVGEEYEFIVIRVDKDKKRVSLGYKQLHLHPFQEFATNYNIGDIVEGTVVRIKEFGAFVKIADGVDGLVHISEASHNFVKNIGEVLKVGDHVKAMITKVDDENRKISLSIKAATEPSSEGSDSDADTKEKKGKKGDKKGRGTKQEESGSWSEDASNNPFADLLKGIQTEDEEN